MLNKVPEVTIFFWVIKIMCTTVGETAADYLNDNLGFGLTKTTYVTGALLIVLLAVQFRLRRYVPGVYWSVVVVISVFGTLITDNMTDHYNVPLTTSTIVFSIVLAAVFAGWFAVERTLSIHTIFTTRREAFYWLAILFTFALGTAAGDLSAEKLDLGYAVSILIFGGLIAAVAIGHYALRPERRPVLLAGLHPDPAAGRVDRRRDVAEQPQVRRPRPGHDRDQLHLPRLHPGARGLPDDHAGATPPRPGGRRPCPRPPDRHAAPSLARSCAITVVTGRPRWATRWGRSRCSQRDTAHGSVERMISSKSSSWSVSSIASIGSWRGETAPSTRHPPARLLDERQGSASTCSPSRHVRMRRLGRAPARVVRIGDEEVKPGRAAGGPLADRIQQRGRRRRLVRDHEDARGSRGFHGSPFGPCRGRCSHRAWAASIQVSPAAEAAEAAEGPTDRRRRRA